MILIFVEIIQLNCFGLSYMTKKNIEIRSRIDSDLVINEEDNDTKIDYQDYSVDLIETKLTEVSQFDLKLINGEFGKTDTIK